MATIPALPASLTKGIKWLLHHPEVIDSPFWILYDHISKQDPASELLWRKIYVRYGRATPSATVEDDAVFTLNVSNITGGQLDGTWTAGDYAAVDGALQELLTGLDPFISTSHTMKDCRYYQAGFNVDLPIGSNVWKAGDPGDEPKRFQKMGPPAHIFLPTGANGSSPSQSAAYQVAMSVTFRTPAPKHWGRVYLPGTTAGELTGTFGRFSTATATAVANLFAEFQDDLNKLDFQVVVPTTQQDGKYATGLSGVTDMVVDDIPDVIRRRRPKQPGFRQIGVPAP